MTLRELVWMAEGASKDRWNHTSHLLALIHNSNPYVKRAINPAELNPFTASDAKSKREEGRISDLKIFLSADQRRALKAKKDSQRPT